MEVVGGYERMGRYCNMCGVLMGFKKCSECVDGVSSWGGGCLIGVIGGI